MRRSFALLALGTALLLSIPSPVALAQGYPYCQPGQIPRFLFGFATLKAQLGTIMGEPTECEHPNSANGDTLQKTTTGLAFYRKATNTPTFTDGWRHWGMTAAGIVRWEGDAVDPPNPRAAALPASAPPPPDPAPRTPSGHLIATSYVFPVIEPPRDNSRFACLARNPSCSRDPWWVEWNEVQEEDLV